MTLGTTDFEHLLVASLPTLLVLQHFEQEPDLCLGIIKDWSTTLADFSVEKFLEAIVYIVGNWFKPLTQRLDGLIRVDHNITSITNCQTCAEISASFFFVTFASPWCAIWERQTPGVNLPIRALGWTTRGEDQAAGGWSMNVL